MDDFTCRCSDGSTSLLHQPGKSFCCELLDTLLRFDGPRPPFRLQPDLKFLRVTIAAISLAMQVTLASRVWLPPLQRQFKITWLCALHFRSVCIYGAANGLQSSISAVS